MLASTSRDSDRYEDQAEEIITNTTKYVCGFAPVMASLSALAQITVDQDAFCNDLSQRPAANYGKAGQSQSACQMPAQKAKNDCLSHQRKLPQAIIEKMVLLQQRKLRGRV
jgi:hypothetical protein